jgi:hypothetical protein
MGFAAPTIVTLLYEMRVAAPKPPCRARKKKTESIKAMIRRSSRCQSSELFYSIKMQFLFKKKKPRTGVVLIRQPLVVPTNTMLKTEMSVTQATEFPAPKLPMLRDETQVEAIH